MPVPVLGNVRTKSRDRLTLARQALDGDSPNVADTAGPTPVGAIGGEQVRDVSENMVETGKPQPTAIPKSYGDVTGTGIAGGVYGDAGAVIGDETPQDNPAMMPDEPVEGETPEDFDEAAAQFNWSLLDQALQGADTSEEEAQMQAQQDRMMGQALMDQRASMGASGFGESGAMMALEGDTRADAARQLGLDVSELRRTEAQRAIENAFGAQKIDIEKMSAADQTRLNELIASFMMNDGELPPEGGGDGGWGDGSPLDGFIPNPIDDFGDRLAHGETPFGKGTDQSETATSGDPEGYETRDSHDEADLFLENYTDPDGKTWSVYRTPNGKRYRVPMGA